VGPGRDRGLTRSLRHGRLGAAWAMAHKAALACLAGPACSEGTARWRAWWQERCALGRARRDAQQPRKISLCSAPWPASTSSTAFPTATSKPACTAEPRLTPARPSATASAPAASSLSCEATVSLPRCLASCATSTSSALPPMATCDDRCRRRPDSAFAAAYVKLVSRSSSLSPTFSHTRDS